MSAVQGLLRQYRRQLSLPGNPYLAPTERVWLAVYDPAEERRVRAHLTQFAQATEEAGWTWQSLDLMPAFARWLSRSPYRESYYAEPELLASALPEFEAALAHHVRQAVASVPAGGVLGVTGAGSLFGLTSVSHLIEQATAPLEGRMLLFFPGSVSGHTFRLLNARDSWNYRSVALTG